MQIINTDLLDEFTARHTAAKKAVATWCDKVLEAAWRTPQDIKNAVRSADFLAGNRVIFNIKGNHYRIVVKVVYFNGLVIVEWVGTHAEYSRKKLN